MAQRNVRRSEDKPVRDGSAARKATKGRKLFKYSISEGNLSGLTIENARKQQATGESLVDVAIDKHLGSIIETSPTKTDIQALIAVPGCSPMDSSGTSETSDPHVEILGTSVDQIKQSLPGIEPLGPKKQDNPKDQALRRREERGGKPVTRGLLVKGSGNDKPALGAQKSVGVNQDGESYPHSSHGRKRKRLLPKDCAFFNISNSVESPEDHCYPDLKKQGQTRTSVTSGSVTARRPLSEMSHFNIQEEITEKVSETKTPGGCVKMAQKRQSQKSRKRLFIPGKENTLCLSNLKQKAKERETPLMTKGTVNSKQDYEDVSNFPFLCTPPPPKSSQSKKTSQASLVSRGPWSCSSCDSLQEPSDTDSKQAHAVVAGNMWAISDRNMQVTKEHSLLNVGAKSIMQAARPNNISDQDVWAAKYPCGNGQHVDQNVGKGSLFGKCSQPSAVSPKQNSLIKPAKPSGFPALGSKTHSQDSQKPMKSLIPVFSRTRLRSSSLQNKKLPVQRAKSASCQASLMHKKEVPKESTVPLKAATLHRQSHSSDRGACGEEMKPPSKAGLIAMKGTAHAFHAAQGTGCCSNRLFSRKEPLLSKGLLARDSQKNWETSKNLLKSTKCDGQRIAMKTAKEKLLPSEPKGRLSGKTLGENYSNIIKSQEKEGGRQHFLSEKKPDVPKASSVIRKFWEPVMPKKIVRSCSATNTQQLSVVRAAEGKFNDKRPDGVSSKVEPYQKKDQSTSHTAKFSKAITSPRRMTSKQLELFQDGLQRGAKDAGVQTYGLQCEAKDAGMQTSLACFIGSALKIDREARHQLLSSLYIAEEQVELVDPCMKPAGRSAPFSFGTYMASECVAMGIMKLREDCEKPMAVDCMHDMCIYALDSGVSLTTFGGAWTLLEEGCAFCVKKGMPYMLKNVGLVAARLFYVLTTPK